MVVTADYKRPELPKVYLGHQSVVIYHKCTHTHKVYSSHGIELLPSCTVPLCTPRDRRRTGSFPRRHHVSSTSRRARARAHAHTHTPPSASAKRACRDTTRACCHTHTRSSRGPPACDLPRHRQVNLNQTTRDTAVHADNPADRSQTHAHTCSRSQTHAHAHTHARAATSSPSTNVSPSHATSRR